VFADASYWVALSDKLDQWHPRAKKLVDRIEPDVRIIDLTAAEALTIIGSRKGGKPAQELYQVFLDSCSIIFVDSELLSRAMDRHLKHDGRLSVPDCATVEEMVRLNDRRILSFDSDFDSIKGLERVH